MAELTLQNIKIYLNRLILLLGLGTICTCAQPSFEATLAIHMLGVYEEPKYALEDECNSGWLEPFQQTYTIEAIEVRYLPKAGGEDTYVSLLTEPLESIAITGRALKVFEIPIADIFKDLTPSDYDITNLKVTLSDQIAVKSKYAAEINGSMGAAVLTEGTACAPETFEPCDEDDQDTQCSIATDDLIGVTSGKSYVYTMKVQWRESVYRNLNMDPPVDELFLPPTLELASPVATD